MSLAAFQARARAKLTASPPSYRGRGQCQPGSCRLSCGCPNINTGILPPTQVKYINVITYKSDNQSFMVNFCHTTAGGAPGL